MNIAEQVLGLVHQALSELETPGSSISSVIRKAIRVARLREDYESLYWLSMEMRSIGDQEAKTAIYLEIAPHFTRTELQALNRRSVDGYIGRRKSNNLELAPEYFGESCEGAVLGLGVPELEEKLQHLREGIRELTTPLHLGPRDYLYLEQRQGTTRTKLQMAVAEWSSILQRVSQAVYEYLSRTEQQLYNGQINADIFEQNRRFVNERLSSISPAALEQLRAAQERLHTGGAEAGSHALTSCRRILKTIADYLYPPRAEPVVGRDGKKRSLTDDKYVSRIWQYIHEKVEGTASRNLLSLQVEELGRRVDRLNELSSKGVHSDVSPFEVQQCVLQTYLLVGDLLRLAEGNSGLESTTAGGQI